MEMNFSSKSLHRVYACLSYYCYGARRYCPSVQCGKPDENR